MSIFSSVKDKVLNYIDVYTRLIRINIIEKTASLLSYVMYGLVVLFIVFCIILFLGFGLTEALMLTGLSKMVSFFITIGIYFLLLLIVFLLRKNIVRFISGGIIKVLTEGDEKEGQDEKD
jgi:hypothetical protein